MNRTHIPGILAMAAIVVASNILVQFLFGQWLTWGAFTYPLAFLVTDVMNRVYGAGPARRVVFAGFLTGVICSLIGTQIMGEFGPLVTDTALFFTIAFSTWLSALEPGNDVSWANEALPLLGAGPVAPLWVSLAVADWTVKLSLALLALIPFRLIVRRLQPSLA